MKKSIKFELQLKRCIYVSAYGQKEPSSSETGLFKAKFFKSKCQALKEYKDIKKTGSTPSIPLVLAALKSCGSSGDVAEIHADVISNGLISNICIANSVVGLYGKYGRLTEARQAFDNITNLSVVSWNSLIMAYAQNGEPELALQLFHRMQELNFVPTPRTYIAAVKACTFLAANEEGRPIDGGRVLRKSLEKGLAVHSQLSKAGFECYVFLANALVDLYGKCGSLKHARDVFDRMRHRDVISWNSIILNYALNGEGEEALSLFSTMQQQTQKQTPNHLTFVAVLKACGNLVALEAGRRLHLMISNEGIHRNTLVATSLVDFYGKCGSMVEAKQVFDATETKDAVAWTAFIAGYTHQGDSKTVFRLFTEMKTTRCLTPNGITYLFVLACCNHAGLVDEGKEYFKEMQLVFSISPTIDHYTCMVDLLARANRLNEALHLINAMPLRPDFGMWISLLAACRKWKNVETGEVAFDGILRLEPDDRNSAAYVLMGNLYGSVGRFGEMQRIREMRINSRSWKKKPAQSWWVENSGKVHRFMVGSDTVLHHPQKCEILDKLTVLGVEMKKLGYVPVLEAFVGMEEMDDCAKEFALCGHSERLAIACALVNTRPGSVVRIGKNLRVCEDCHAVTEFISRIERRVVVCRDSSRFHVFQDGKCTCGGFW